MKAFVLRSYGSPDVLELTDLDRPVPGRDEVLVRVRATSVQPVRLALHERPAVHRAPDGPAAPGCAGRSSASWAPTWRGRSRRSART